MVRTRFAPSPTGYLHIGGVRTALFNWLLAKQAGGQFILRIDDTDQERNVNEAIQPILDGFRWLGMDWDEGPDVGGPFEPYYQSQRADHHQAAAEKLLASGHAYRDYSRPDELQALREAAEKQGERFFYDRRWMAESDEQAAAFEAEGRPKTVRLKMPRAGECVINDLVRGEVRFAWDQEQDTVIQRPDGSCLYHLASTVDDQEFGITHVVRAEEHLSNTPRQIFILESLGYERPEYAHLPFVADPKGSKKLSKRKLKEYVSDKGFSQLLEQGKSIASRCQIDTDDDTFNPVLVDFYREIGCDPDAILNYLLLLGWSLDGETEKFTVKEMIEKFSLERVNKSKAAFDVKKLIAFQGDAFVNLSLDTRVDRARPFAKRAGLLEAADAESQLRAVVEGASDRMKIAGDILEFDYFFVDEIEYDQKAFKKRICKPENAQALLRQLRNHLAEATAFDATAVEASVNAFCESAGIELKDVIHAIRVATTGRPGGFGMFDTLAVLGKDTVLKRMDVALEQAATICAGT
ncbi:MAG: glutamate--tRNA ligase [Rubripirellula sp.]